MRQEHEVRTGNSATDKMVADEMKSSFEQAGMRVTVSPMTGGGYNVVTELEMPAPVATAAAQASAVTGQAFSMHAFELGGDERHELVTQLAAGDLTSTLAFLGRTRTARDWDDRAFMLGLVAGSAPTSAVEVLAQRLSGDPDACLLSGAHHLDKAWEARGTGTADTITAEGSAAMGRHLARAKTELEAAAALAASDPTPCALLIGVSQLGGPVDAHRAFQAAVARHPGDLAAYQRMVSLSTEKWGGNLDACLSLARRAAFSGTAGSDASSVVFRAHFEAWFYRKRFEQNEAAAQAYVSNRDVRTELERTFEAWVTPSYQSKRSSVTPLHWAAAWFFLVGDTPRMKRAMKLTNNVPPEDFVPWCWISDLAYTQAVQAAAYG
jgi:hypothetical protein